MWRLLALAFLAASAAHAETYKWVDQNGVVNYSNTPPPAAAKNAQTITERVSTYELDPALRQAVAYGPSPYEQMLQQEWLQRQRLMAERQNVQTIYDNPVEPYRAAYPGYYYPASFVRPVQHRRQSFSSSSSRWR
jgi:hypothetical protein